MSAETSPGRPEISEHAVQEPFSVKEPPLLKTQANEDLVVSSLEVGNADEASPTLDASLNANKLALTIMESEGHSPPIIDDNGVEKQEDSLKPEGQEAGGNQSLVDPTNKSLTEATEDSTVGMVEVEQPSKKSEGGVSLEEKESPETGAMLQHDEKTGELPSPTPDLPTTEVKDEEREEYIEEPLQVGKLAILKEDDETSSMSTIEDTSEIENVSLEEKAEEITETGEMPQQYEASLSATEETGERASPIHDLLTTKVKNEECCEENVEGPPQAGKPAILKEDDTSSLSTIEDSNEIEYVSVEKKVEEFLEMAPLLQEIIGNTERALLEKKAEEAPETGVMQQQDEVSLSATEKTGERSLPTPKLPTIEVKPEEHCDEKVEEPAQAGKPAILKDKETRSLPRIKDTCAIITMLMQLISEIQDDLLEKGEEIPETCSLSTIMDTIEIEDVSVEETVEEFLEIAPLLQEIINIIEGASLEEKAEETPKTGATQQQDEVNLSATEKTGEDSLPTVELPTTEVKHEERCGEKDDEAPQAGKPAILQQDEEISDIDVCSSLMKRLQLTDKDSP